MSAAGVGYFVYSKIKIYGLNKKISTINDAYQQISEIDVSQIVIPQADITVEAEVPLYSADDDIGMPAQYTEQDWTDYFDEFMYGNSGNTNYVDQEGTVLYTDHG